MSDQANHEKVLFEKALSLASAAERSAYLKGACGDDAALLERSQALLTAHEQAHESSPDDPSAKSTVPDERPWSEKPGGHIGHYKLLQQIGEGGCGVVYMAEQEEPVRRRVALKVIKLGMDTRSVIARFEAERQVLALMDHPNIARVLDAGATATGRPFFVMELVRGIKITDYCDQNQLSTPQRLELFAQVCIAIQHAHQKGIIHRDIKPSNILVTLHDGVPVPKVIDFGIAKATTEHHLTNKTLFTALEQFIGTPAYMSPEQAEMSGLDIDTRADIYALGVLLYELLTGRTPFDAKELLKAGMEEMRRVIREQEPARPSTRLSTMQAADLAAMAQRRRTEPPKLVSLVRGDLDWIVMKTLEKDRTRRYETANSLALDIQRHLDNEPVLARPPNTVYRVERFVRRHQRAVALTVALACATAVSVVVQTVNLLRAHRAEAVARRAEHSAQTVEREQVRLRAEAVKAQALEAQLRLGAETAGSQLRNTLHLMQIQRAEELFVADDTARALAHLARVLRQDPSNGLAASRIFFALNQRSFALPLTEFLKHDQQVVSAQYSPDSQRVVTASRDRTARIWDARTGEALAGPLRFGDAARIGLAATEAKFSPDGRQVLTLGGLGARLWDASTGHPATEPLLHEANLRAGAFNPDGRLLLTTAVDGTVRVWDTGTGRLLTDLFKNQEGRRLEQFKRPDELGFAQFSPDGQRLITASGRSTQVWEARTGRLMAEQFYQQVDPIGFAELSPDLQRMVAVSGKSDAKAARLWDVNSGLPLSAPLKLDSGQPLINTEFDAAVTGLLLPYVHFSPDGRRLLTVFGLSGRLWEAHTGQPLGEPFRHRANILAACFSPEGQRMLTASFDGTARIWDGRTGQPVTEPLRPGPAEWAAWAQFSPDGQSVVTAAGTITRIWEVRPGQALANAFKLDAGEPAFDFYKHQGEVNSAQFSPDSRRVVTASYYDAARIWDASSGQAVTQPLRHQAGVVSARFSPDGQRLVTASRDRTARIWDAQTGRPLTEPLKHDGPVRSACFSPDGRRVVTTSDDQTARIWDAQTGQPLAIPLKHARGVRSAQFSPDGQRVVTASTDYTARIWDANSGQPVSNPLKHTGSVQCAEFSPNGRSVVTASTDNTAHVWDSTTGRPLTEPLRHQGIVTSAHFSPDGEHVVTASWDQTARIWDAATGRPLTEPLQHQSVVTDAQFSLNGQWVVTASRDTTARVWKVKTGQPVTEPLPHEGVVTSVQFSPDGEHLVTVSGVTVRLWETPSLALPVPAWAAQLAETVAGLRFDENGLLATVPISELLALRKQFTELAGTDGWSRWAKWFFADRGTRAISPFSDITVAEHVRRRLQENTEESMLEVLKLAPTNGLAYANLARLILKLPVKQAAARLDEAEWFSRCASQYAPALPISQEMRVQVADRAVEMKPDDPAGWLTRGIILERAQRLEEAEQAYAKALQLSETNHPGLGEVRHQALWHREQLRTMQHQK